MDKQTFSCNFNFDLLNVAHHFDPESGELTLEYHEDYLHAGLFTGSLRDEVIKIINQDHPDRFKGCVVSDTQHISESNELRDALERETVYVSLALMGRSYSPQLGYHKEYQITWFNSPEQYQRYLDLWVHTDPTQIGFRDSKELNIPEIIKWDIIQWLYRTDSEFNTTEEEVMKRNNLSFWYAMRPQGDLSEQPISDVYLDKDSFTGDQIPIVLSLCFYTDIGTYSGESLTFNRKPYDWLISHPKETNEKPNFDQFDLDLAALGEPDPKGFRLKDNFSGSLDYVLRFAKRIIDIVPEALGLSKIILNFLSDDVHSHLPSLAWRPLLMSPQDAAWIRESSEVK